MMALQNRYAFQNAPYMAQVSAWPAQPVFPAIGTSTGKQPQPPFASTDDVSLLQAKSSAKPTHHHRLMSGLKAAGYLSTAIFMARYAPGKATTELIPSDWKVWAKMGLSVASLGQFNKAMNWEPPPWLAAMMNVLLVSPLVSGKNGLRMLPILLPTVGGLVQGTHVLTDKAEHKLQEQYGIPPMATRLAMSVLSMGAGFVAIPRLFGLFRNTWLYPRAEVGKAAMATAASTCSRGCCASAVCVNEIADYGAALAGWIQGSSPQQRKE